MAPGGYLQRQAADGTLRWRRRLQTHPLMVLSLDGRAAQLLPPPDQPAVWVGNNHGSLFALPPAGSTDGKVRLVAHAPDVVVCWCGMLHACGACGPAAAGLCCSMAWGCMPRSGQQHGCEAQVLHSSNVVDLRHAVQLCRQHSAALQF